MYALSIRRNIFKNDDTVVTSDDEDLHKILKKEDGIELLLLYNTTLYRKVFRYKYKSKSFDLMFSLRKRLKCDCDTSNKHMLVNLSKLFVSIEYVSCLRCNKREDISNVYCYEEYKYLHNLFTDITKVYMSNYKEQELYTIHIIYMRVNLYYPHVSSVM